MFILILLSCAIVHAAILYLVIFFSNAALPTLSACPLLIIKRFSSAGDPSHFGTADLYLRLTDPYLRLSDPDPDPAISSVTFKMATESFFLLNFLFITF